MGFKQREEWREDWSPNPSPIPDSDPANTVPQGMPTPLSNQFLTYRNSFHWDQTTYDAANCQSGTCDYTKARIRHFTHDAASFAAKSTTIESTKYPLENRIWYNYPTQSASYLTGSYTKPTAIGRVLDDGTSQISKYSYDTQGFF
jgi:hypothetical protein